MIIESRYNGPPGTGNGGYSAGTFASAAGLDAPAVEVTLRKPPPLEVPLTVTGGGEAVQVTDPEGALVAQLRPAVLGTDEVVPAVSWDEAVEASKGYPGFSIHPFPTCF